MLELNNNASYEYTCVWVCRVGQGRACGTDAVQILFLSDIRAKLHHSLDVALVFLISSNFYSLL